MHSGGGCTRARHSTNCDPESPRHLNRTFFVPETSSSGVSPRLLCHDRTGPVNCVLCTSLYTIDQSRQPIKRSRKKGSRNFDPVDISRSYNEMNSDTLIVKSLNLFIETIFSIATLIQLKTLIAYNWLLTCYETHFSLQHPLF